MIRDTKAIAAEIYAANEISAARQRMSYTESAKEKETREGNSLLLFAFALIIIAAIMLYVSERPDNDTRVQAGMAAVVDAIEGQLHTEQSFTATTKEENGRRIVSVTSDTGAEVTIPVEDGVSIFSPHEGTLDEYILYGVHADGEDYRSGYSELRYDSKSTNRELLDKWRTAG